MIKGVGRALSRRYALVIPFIVGPIVIRLFVGPMSNALASVLLAAAPAPPTPVESAAPTDPDDDSRHDGTSDHSGAGSGTRRHAQRSSSARRVAAGGHGGSTTDGGAARSDAGTMAPSIDGPAKGTIVVPAAAIAKAIEKKDVGTSNAVSADGKPFGARIHGVSKYRAGLRDGDVIVMVGGQRTETSAAMMEAGTRVLASGATKITGRIVRGEDVFDVVLELPSRD